MILPVLMLWFPLVTTVDWLAESLENDTESNVLNAVTDVIGCTVGSGKPSW